MFVYFGVAVFVVVNFVVVVVVVDVVFVVVFVVVVVVFVLFFVCLCVCVFFFWFFFRFFLLGGRGCLFSGLFFLFGVIVCFVYCIYHEILIAVKGFVYCSMHCLRRFERKRFMNIF